MNYMFWNVKGYKGIQITKEGLKEKKYALTELKNKYNDIEELVNNNLEENGVALGLIKKNKVKVVYLFKVKKGEKETSLILDTKFVLDDMDKCIKQFEKDLNTVLNSVLIDRFDIDKAVWQRKTIKRKDNFKNFFKFLNIFTCLGVFICLVMLIATFVCGSIYSMMTINNLTIEEVKEDGYLLSYVSDINNYTYDEIITKIDEIEYSVDAFVVNEIIIPTVLSVFGYLLLIIALCDILRFIRKVKDYKTLFTNEKNFMLKRIFFRLFLALLFVLGDFMLWIVSGMVLSIIEYLFNYCVQMTVNKEVNV